MIILIVSIEQTRQKDCERCEEVETPNNETIVFVEHSYKTFDHLFQPSLPMAKHGKTSLEWAEGRIDLYGLMGFSLSPRAMSGGVGISESEE